MALALALALPLALTDNNVFQTLPIVVFYHGCLQLIQGMTKCHIASYPVFPLALTDINGFQTLCFYHVCLLLMLRITTNTLEPLVPLYPLLVETISLQISRLCSADFPSYCVCLQLLLRITTNTLEPLVPLYPLLVLHALSLALTDINGFQTLPFCSSCWESQQAHYCL